MGVLLQTFAERYVQDAQGEAGEARQDEDDIEHRCLPAVKVGAESCGERIGKRPVRAAGYIGMS
jgi:hypothetical protein